MPCPSYSLPASMCQVGAKLAQRKNTICSICYAKRGNYQFDNVRRAQMKRLDALKHPDWAVAMAILIQPHRYFRWHDSGDLQGIEHFRQVCWVAKLTPGTQHWLPTREHRYILGDIPRNLVVRYSLSMIDQSRPKNGTLCSSILTSGVVSESSTCQKHIRPRGTCGMCRKCWDPEVQHVTYQRH